MKKHTNVFARLNRVISFFVGFPFLLYLASSLPDETLFETIECQIQPQWWIRLFFHYLTHPVRYNDPKAGDQCARFYIGNFAATCRLGHHHYSAQFLLSRAVIWWNIKNGKNPLNYVQGWVHKGLMHMVDEMKNCGFHRSAPLFEDKSPEVDSQIALNQT